MKTMILAAAAVFSFGVGAAFAQGLPAGGYSMPHYGAAAFDHADQSAHAQSAGQGHGDSSGTRAGG